MIKSALFWEATRTCDVTTVLRAYSGWTRTKKGEDILLANRKGDPRIVLLSYGVPSISTSALVGRRASSEKRMGRGRTTP
jgi:hypothetical protein